MKNSESSMMTNDITIIKANGQRPDDKGIEVCLKEESIRDQARNARELFSGLQNELDEIEDDLKDGLSYLDMKNDTLLSYMIDVCNIVLRKVRGEAILKHPSVERSVYYRVILEKIKAIDQRLAYQLNKVITMPDNAGEQAQGVNIGNLDVDLGSEDDQDEEDVTTREKQSRDESDYDDDDDDDEDDDEDDEDDGSVDSDASEASDKANDDIGDESEIEDEPVVKKDSKNARAGRDKKPVGVYKPPKLRSVAYDDGEGSKTRRRRDYNEFYQDDDNNQDIVEETRAHRDDERTRYEEDNYTRLPDMNPKKAKRKAKQAKLKSKKKFKGGGKRK